MTGGDPDNPFITPPDQDGDGIPDVYDPDQKAVWSWTGAGGADVLTEVLDQALAEL